MNGSVITPPTWNEGGRAAFQQEIENDRKTWATNKPYLSEGLLVLLMRCIFIGQSLYHQSLYLKLISYLGFPAWCLAAWCIRKRIVHTNAKTLAALPRRAFHLAIDIYTFAWVSLLLVGYLLAYWQACVVRAEPDTYHSWIRMGVMVGAGLLSMFRVYEVFGVACRLHTRRLYYTKSPIRALMNTVFHYGEVALAFGTLYLIVHVICDDRFGGKSMTDSFMSAAYFSVITLATVGYGDYSPESVPGRLFVILEIMLGLVLIVVIIQRVLSAKHGKRKRKNVNKGAQIMDQCAKCGADLVPHTDATPRAPCPKCGATIRNIGRSTSDHMHTIDSVSWKQSRPGTQATATLDDKGNIKLSATGPCPKNEEDSLPACARFVRMLNTEKPIWSEPVAGTERQADCLSMNVNDGSKLQMQVVQARIDQTYWRMVDREGAAQVTLDAQQAAEDLMNAVRHKVGKYKEAGELILLLFAGRTPEQTFQPVIDAFRKMHLAECKDSGFAQVWVVGPTDTLVLRLDQ